MLNLFSKKSISEQNITVYYLMQFCHSLIFSIPIWIVFYRRVITIEEISFLVGFQYFIQIIAELPTGAFADILGKRVSIIIGFLFFAASSLLFPFAQGFTHYLVLAAFMGLADSFLSGSVDALLYDSLKQDGRETEFAAVLAKQSIFYQLGLVTSTALGGLIYKWHIFAPFFIEGSFFLLGGFFASLLREPKVDSEIFTIRNYLRQIKHGAKEAFKNSFLKKLSWFYIMVGAITWSAALYFNSSLMVDLGFSDEVRGFLLGLMRLFNIVFLTNLLKNKKLFTERNSIIFFPVLMIIALLPGIYLQSWWALPFVAGSMAASTARWIVLGRMTNDHFSSKYRSTAISTLSMVIGIFYTMFTIISGPVIKLGTTRLMYTILGLVTVVVVVPLAKSLLLDIDKNSKAN
ncbi:MAG: MFS transporter [Candidatus Pacebacteria bacterium]|nr:MFS transporter [Candidatus Paceibacterota bacterium]